MRRSLRLMSRPCGRSYLIHHAFPGVLSPVRVGVPSEPCRRQCVRSSRPLRSSLLSSSLIITMGLTRMHAQAVPLLSRRSASLHNKMKTLPRHVILTHGQPLLKMRCLRSSSPRAQTTCRQGSLHGQPSARTAMCRSRTRASATGSVCLRTRS